MVLIPEPKPKHEEGHPPPPKPHHPEIPPHILRKLLELRKRVGNFEVMMEKGTPEEKRDLILDLGENLILKDKNIVFNFKTPYDVLLLPEYRQSMLALVDYVGTFYRQSFNQL